jgi:hypothetical protein
MDPSAFFVGVVVNPETFIDGAFTSYYSGKY